MFQAEKNSDEKNHLASDFQIQNFPGGPGNQYFDMSQPLIRQIWKMLCGDMNPTLALV